MKTFRKRFRKAMSRPRSSVRNIRKLISSSSFSCSASSNFLRSPFLMQSERGRKSLCRLGNGFRRSRLGRVWVVRRWHGIKKLRIFLYRVSEDTQPQDWEVHTPCFVGRFCDKVARLSSAVLQPAKAMSKRIYRIFSMSRLTST